MDNISTDEIIPGWCCFWYDEKLGDYAYLGLRGRKVAEGAVRSFAPQVVVSGEAKGCGSSREHAVYAERYAGVEIVFARSFERIYEQNCRNVGIITCDDFDVLDALLAGEELPLDAFTRRANHIERAIIDLGGLFGFNREYRDGARPPIRPEFAPNRPLNMIEKIIQRRLSSRNQCPPDGSVQVGQTYFVETDVRFSHEYVTPMAAGMFVQQFGPEARLAQPETCYFFQDHLSLAPPVLRRRPNGAELVARVEDLGRRQREFAALAGGVFIGPAEAGGSRAILVRVPAVIRINLLGGLRPGVCAKDLMLTLLTHPKIQGSRTLGRVLLFTGPGCATLDVDERATLCNMAVEAGAMTAVFEPDQVTWAYLSRRGPAASEARTGTEAGVGSGAVPVGPHAPAVVQDGSIVSDENATYASVVDVPLGEIEPMVALPGDPRNSVPLASITDEVRVDKVYGGSCTGGKAHDMDMYASIFELARARGVTVAPGVRAYIQVGSEAVMRHARERGYLDLFQQVGVNVLPPSCGACINAGPGVSESPDEITVSAQNRNFPGARGPARCTWPRPTWWRPAP